MAQGPIAATIAVNPSGVQRTVKSTEDNILANCLDSDGEPAVPTLNADGGVPTHITNTVNTVNVTPTLSTTLNISAATLVKAGAGMVGTVTVVVKGSGNGTLNDCATTGAASAANAFFALDDTATSATVLNFPTTLGIVVTPGTGQTIAISWK